MSALTPHIRVLRAEGAALITQSQSTHADAKEAAQSRTGEADIQFTVALLLACMGKVKLTVADKIEAEEPKLPEDEHPITYDPKVKR